MEWNLLHKVLVPFSLQAKHKIKIEVLEGCNFINLPLRLISCSTVGRSFQVKSSMYSILRAEQIAHYYKPCLISNQIKLVRYPIAEGGLTLKSKPCKISPHIIPFGRQQV